MTQNELIIVFAYLFSFSVMFVSIIRAYRGWSIANKGWERANAGWKASNELNKALVQKVEELEIDNLMRDIDAEDVTVLRDMNGRVLSIHAIRRGQSREIYQA